MIDIIAWKEYLMIVGVALVLYYGYVGVKYLPRWLGWTGHKNIDDPDGMADDILEEEQASDTGEEVTETMLEKSKSAAPVEKPVKKEPTLLTLAQELGEQIKKLVIGAGKAKTVKEELLFALRKLLDGEIGQRLKNGELRHALNNLIRFNIEQYCGYRLDSEELNSLWLGSEPEGIAERGRDTADADPL